jgi:flavin-dependent dehydrogenase
MKKQKTEESFMKWIPGTDEFNAAAEVAMERSRKEKLSMNLEKLKEYEKLWRNTIKKAEKTWKDRWILSNVGISNEKELDELLDLLRKTYLDDAKPISIKEKETFLNFLLKMITYL